MTTPTYTPPDPNNPRDIRNRPAYRRMKERLRRERDQQLTLAEPVQVQGQGHAEGGDEGAVTVPAVDPGAGHHNDFRNAREYISTCAEDVRYCVSGRSWFEWNDLRWELDVDEAGMHERARHFSESLIQHSQTLPMKEGQMLYCRAVGLGNMARIRPMLELARRDPRIFVRKAALWDADPMLLGVENGVLDLLTVRFVPAERSMMMTKAAAVTYDPAATCPRWDAFVEQILPDPEVRLFMQVTAGYWLTGDTGAQCFWFLYGSGSNGKSTFLETIYRLCGDYGQRVGAMLVATPDTREARLEISTLPGRRLLVGSEASDGMKLNETLVKDITGGDTITGRGHYKNGFAFRPSCKLVMYGNHRPTISGTDGGIWRRVRLVPFTHVVTPEQRIPGLEKMFTSELPGILNWCLRGLAHWHQHGLPMPEAVKNATEGYREDSDPLGEFLQEHTERVADKSKRVLLTDLFKKYEAWCEESGRKWTLSKQTLRLRMEDRGHAMKHTNKGRALYGLQFKDANGTLTSHSGCPFDEQDDDE